MDDIDRELEGFSILAAAVSDAMTRLERQRNSMAPIHRLPAELLAQIFLEASHPGFPDLFQEHDNYIECLHAFAQVCTSWAAIVRDTPSLWTVVQLGTGSGASGWAMALDRAGLAALDVRFYGWTISGCGVMDKAFWSTVIQESTCWRLLGVSVGWSSRLESLESLSAPNLEIMSLRVHLDKVRLPRGFHRFFIGKLPKLTELTMWGIVLRDWTPLLSGNLHSLTLVLCSFGEAGWHSSLQSWKPLRTLRGSPSRI